MRRANFLTVVLVLCGLSGCSTNPATGRNQLILVSSAQIAAMGEAAEPEMTQQYGGEVDSLQLRGYVDRVGQRLARHIEPAYANIQWRFTVLDSDVINAFALPGGRVFISRGLLQQFGNEAQVAGVLGHEIGHVTGRHVDERLSQVIVANLGLGVAVQSTDSDLALLAARLVSAGTLLKFNRDQEGEADEQGLKYMARSGYDPHAMLEVLEILAEAGRGPRQPEFLSTHPHPESRMQNVARLLEGRYRSTQDNPEFRKYSSRFQQEAAPYLPSSP